MTDLHEEAIRYCQQQLADLRKWRELPLGRRRYSSERKRLLEWTIRLRNARAGMSS
jgi:hypothetical protein